MHSSLYIQKSPLCILILRVPANNQLHTETTLQMKICSENFCMEIYIRGHKSWNQLECAIWSRSSVYNQTSNQCGIPLAQICHDKLIIIITKLDTENLRSLQVASGSGSQYGALWCFVSHKSETFLLLLFLVY